MHWCEFDVQNEGIFLISQKKKPEKTECDREQFNCQNFIRDVHYSYSILSFGIVFICYDVVFIFTQNLTSHPFSDFNIEGRISVWFYKCSYMFYVRIMSINEWIVQKQISDTLAHTHTLTHMRRKFYIYTIFLKCSELNWHSILLHVAKRKVLLCTIMCIWSNRICNFPHMLLHTAYWQA